MSYSRIPNRPKVEMQIACQCPHCDRYVYFLDLATKSRTHEPPAGTKGMCGGCGRWWEMGTEGRLIRTQHKPTRAQKLEILIAHTLE